MDDRAKQLAALLNETYRHCGGSGERAGIFAAVAAVLAPIAADVAALKAVRKPAVEHPWSQEIEDYYRDDAPPALVPHPHPAPLCHVCGQGVANPIATAKGPAHPSCAAEGTLPEQPGPTRGAEVISRVMQERCMGMSVSDREAMEVAVNAECAAVRAQAFTGAERAVMCYAYESHTTTDAKAAMARAAKDVARLREGT